MCNIRADRVSRQILKLSSRLLKMSRAVFAVMLVIGVLFSITIAQQCPENMQFTTCGSACPPSCTPNSGRCTKQCVVGCQCIPGFVRDSAGNCVSPQNC